MAKMDCSYKKNKKKIHSTYAKTAIWKGLLETFENQCVTLFLIIGLGVMKMKVTGDDSLDFFEEMATESYWTSSVSVDKTLANVHLC